MKKLAPLCILGASILWGSMGIVTRYVADLGFHTRQTAAVRIGSAAICLVLFLLIRNPKGFRIAKKDIKWFLGTGFLSLFINNLTYAQTVQIASLSVAVVLLYTAPFFVMIFSVLFFHEKLTLQKVSALILSFVGCIFVVGLSSSGIGNANLAATLGFGLSAGLAYSLYSIFGKVLTETYDSLTITTYTFIVATIATFAICEPVSMFRKIGENLSAMPLAVLGSVITLAMPYILYSAGLKYTESSKASIIASFEVVAASLFGVILYQERLNAYNILGIVLVVSALILLQLNLRKKA